MSNFIDHNNIELNLTAPTLNQLSFVLKDQVGDRKTDAESQKFEIEEFIAEYLKNPDKKRGVIPQKINRFFKTMPSMKGQLSE